MVRPFGKLVLSFGVVALLTSLAWAQQGRGFGMMGGGAGFLMAANVQKDMKLSEEQVGKIQDVLRASFEKHQDDFAALRDVEREERAAKQAALSRTINEEIKKELKLSDDQSKRFDQIAIQARGVQAFADPAVAAKLKLTDDQKAKIRELAPGRGGAGAFNKDATKEERIEAAKKAAATRRENLAKVQAMLTDDQKQAWKELTGEPIEIQFQGFGRGGRQNNNN